MYTRSLGNREDGFCVKIRESGNLPDVGTGMRILDHEALIVPFLTYPEGGRRKILTLRFGVCFWCTLPSDSLWDILPYFPDKLTAVQQNILIKAEETT